MLQRIKSGYEIAVNNLVMILRKQQLIEARKALNVAEMRERFNLL